MLFSVCSVEWLFSSVMTAVPDPRAGFSTDAEVEIEARAGELVVRPLHGARAGWAAAFARMATTGDDALLDPPVETEFDRADWQW